MENNVITQNSKTPANEKSAGEAGARVAPLAAPTRKRSRKQPVPPGELPAEKIWAELERKKAEEEARQKAEEEAKRKAEEEARQRAEAEKAPVQNAPVQNAPVQNAEAAKVEKANANREKINKKANRLRYYERKREALGREYKNYTKLIFIEGEGKDSWVKGFDNTAVIFVSRIAPLFKSGVQLRQDKDYEVRSKYGFVSYNSIEKLQEKLESIDGMKIELIDAKNGVYTFDLGFRITPEEFNLMLEHTQAVIDRANKIMIPDVMMPVLYTELTELSTMTFWIANRMGAPTRELIGGKIYEIASKMLMDYTMLARGSKESPTSVLKRLLRLIEEFNGRAVGLTALKILEDDTVYNLAEQIMKVRKQIIYEMQREKSREVERETGGRIR